MKKIFISKLFTIGLLIRVLIMPFTGHYDIRGINFAIYNLPFNNVINIYEVVERGDLDYLVNVNFGREYFVYPPLTYFTLGGFMYLLKPFYGQEFVSWIQGYGSDTLSVVTHPQVFRYLFLMKLPYLFFDLLTFWILLKIVDSKNRKKTVFYWWLNPISIYLIYIWGQFDIIPVFFSLLSYYLLQKNQIFKSAIAIGIAASFKNYPLMFLPFLALVSSLKLSTQIKVFIIGFATYIITLLPFIRNKFFIDTVLTSRHSQKLMDFLIPIGGDNAIYPFIVGYILLFLFSYRYLISRKDLLILPISITLLWYYSTVNFHHQWFLWLLPFISLIFIKIRELSKYYYWIILIFFFRMLVIQADIGFEMFRWISPAFEDIPKTRTIMGHIYDINRLRNISNSLYAATTIFLTFELLKSYKKLEK